MKDLHTVSWLCHTLYEFNLGRNSFFFFLHVSYKLFVYFPREFSLFIYLEICKKRLIDFLRLQTIPIPMLKLQKDFYVSWFCLGWFLVLLGIFSLSDGWYFSHNSSLVLSCTRFQRPSWHRHALQLSADFMFDIFGCILVPQVPESVSDPIKKEGLL